MHGQIASLRQRPDNHISLDFCHSAPAAPLDARRTENGAIDYDFYRALASRQRQNVRSATFRSLLRLVVRSFFAGFR